jgi:hypothetical protein
VHSLCVFFIFRAKELPQEKFFIPALSEGITRKGGKYFYSFHEDVVHIQRLMKHLKRYALKMSMIKIESLE